MKFVTNLFHGIYIIALYKSNSFAWCDTRYAMSVFRQTVPHFCSLFLYLFSCQSCRSQGSENFMKKFDLTKPSHTVPSQSQYQKLILWIILCATNGFMILIQLDVKLNILYFSYFLITEMLHVKKTLYCLKVKTESKRTEVTRWNVNE